MVAAPRTGDSPRWKTDVVAKVENELDEASADDVDIDVQPLEENTEQKTLQANKKATAATVTAHRGDVDGLRAVAVVAVIIYHADKEWLPGGFTGVDIFFVISGFVVAGSLLRKQSVSLGGFLAAFYARRVKRLTPSLLCMVLCTVLGVAILLDPSTPIDDYYVSAQFALVGWANNHFAARGTGYADEGMEGLDLNPFTHAWSLGYRASARFESVESRRFLFHASRSSRALAAWRSSSTSCSLF